MDLGLANKRALITGASRGIGLAIAEGFLREGAQVVLLARTVGSLGECASRVVEQHGSKRLLSLATDCADEDLMTATPFCILPVTGLNHSKIGSGSKGPITRALLQRWSHNVGVNVEQQIKDYGTEVRELQQAGAPTPYQFRSKKRLLKCRSTWGVNR